MTFNLPCHQAKTCGAVLNCPFHTPHPIRQRVLSGLPHVIHLLLIPPLCFLSPSPLFGTHVCTQVPASGLLSRCSGSCLASFCSSLESPPRSRILVTVPNTRALSVPFLPFIFISAWKISEGLRVVQGWVSPSYAGETGSISGWGRIIPHAARH